MYVMVTGHTRNEFILTQAHPLTKKKKKHSAHAHPFSKQTKEMQTPSRKGITCALVSQMPKCCRWWKHGPQLYLKVNWKQQTPDARDGECTKSSPNS